MSGYTRVFEGRADAQELAARMLVDFHDRTGIPAREGNVETALIEVAAHAHAQTRLVVNDLADEAMMAMAGFLGIERKRATPAAAEATLTGEAGFVVPAGSQFATEDETVWELVTDTTLASGGVVARVVAAVPGPVGERALGEAMQIGPFAKLEQVRITRVVTDGAVQESVGAYLDRAAKETRLMSIVPRLPDEFAQAAKRHPQVANAIAVNLLDDQRRAGRPGHITVFVGNAQGTEIDSSVINEITRLLNADTARPLGVRVHVAQPTRKSFSVEVEVWGSGDADVVDREVKQRLAAYFSPASWDWMTSSVDHYDIAAVIRSTPGVYGIESITFNGARNGIQLSESSQPVVPVATVTVQVRG